MCIGKYNRNWINTHMGNKIVFGVKKTGKAKKKYSARENKPKPYRGQGR